MRVLQRETDSRETQRKKEDVSKILVLQQGLQQPVQRQRGKD